MGKEVFVDVGQIESNDNDMSIWYEKKCGDQMGWNYMGVSKNRGTPKSSILIGFSMK